MSEAPNSSHRRFSLFLSIFDDASKTPKRRSKSRFWGWKDGRASAIVVFHLFYKFFRSPGGPNMYFHRWASAASERAKRAKRAERCRRSRLDHVSILCTSTQSDSPSGANTKQGMTHHRPTTAHANARQTLCFIWLARVPARFHFQRASRSYVNTRFLKNAPGITFSIIFAFPGVPR